MGRTAYLGATLAICLAIAPMRAETFSLRSTELLRYQCEQETFRRDITVFANGTVRLREGIPSSRTLRLAELDQLTLKSIKARLAAIDLSETDSSYESDLGDGLESCTLRVDPEGNGQIEEVRFNRIEVSTLAIHQLIEIAEDLAKSARALDDKGRDLPLDYKPVQGDILRRFDDLLFEVLYFSADGLEVELEGVGQPMTIVVPIMDIHEVFISIEPREDS